MSEAPKGSYSSAVVYDEAKRYFIMQAQKNRPLLDVEVRELNTSLMTAARRQIISLMGDVATPAEPYSSPVAGSGPNNAFKIVESSGYTGSSLSNNFLITGGSGLEDPAILYLDGYYLFLKGSFDYRAQGYTGLLTSDSYTKTIIPPLNTPIPSDPTVSNNIRTDLVYVDFSLAEVTAGITGSEYTDPSIKDPVIGVNTANRLRAVIDIRVQEGWTGLVDSNIFNDPFFDPDKVNQIQHYRCPIAAIERPVGDPTITTAMITDLLELHDRRVYTPKELTHRTRHGGYTQIDVDAGRAIPSDLDESWGATGKNEGFDTEAFNSDSVTPRVLDTAGKFKMDALVVGSTGITEGDAEQLLTGEISSGTAYLNRISVGFSGVSVVDQRGDTGAVVHVDNRGQDVAAVATRTDTEDSAILVREGDTDVPTMEVLGKGWIGVNTGYTGPLRELDVVGDARVSTDVEIGRDLVVGEDALVGSRLSVGNSGIYSVGDIHVRSGEETTSALHIGTTGTDSDYWTHVVANHNTKVTEFYNSAGAPEVNFEWQTDIAGVKSTVMALSNDGDMQIRGDLLVNKNLGASGSLSIGTDAFVRGITDVMGGLRTQSFPVASADAVSHQNWYKIGTLRLPVDTNTYTRVLSLRLVDIGDETYSLFWDADVSIACSVIAGAPNPTQLAILTKGTSSVSGAEFFQVVRSSTPVLGNYEYEMYVKPRYAESTVSAVVLGGNALEEIEWTTTLAPGSLAALPAGEIAVRNSSTSIDRHLWVDGNFGVSGSATFNGPVQALDSVYMGDSLYVEHGISSGDGGFMGDGFVIPAPPTVNDPAWIGDNVTGYTGGPDHTLEVGTGVLAKGSTGIWGTFIGTNEEGLVGFKLGQGNTQPGRARARGWLPSDLRTVVDRSPSLRGIIGIAFDLYGNCIAAIKDYALEGPVSLVYVDTLSRATMLLATGFRAASDLKSSPDGFLYMTSELSIPSHDQKLARVTLYYGPDQKPTSASIQPIALDTEVRGLAGVAVSKAVMSSVLPGVTFPTGTLFVIENSATSAKLLAVDPATGITTSISSGYSNIAAIEAGSVFGAGHAIYLVSYDTGAVLQRVQMGGTSVDFGQPSPDLAFIYARKLHLGVDGYLYAVDGTVTADSGRVIRYDQNGLADLIISGLSDPRSFCINSRRVMHIGEISLGTIYSRAVPGSLVVHMDYPVTSDKYAFPGSVAIATEVKEVEIDVGSAGLLSIYGSDVKIDKRLAVENDAFFGSDVYVDGNLHMDSMEAGDFRATVMVVGRDAPAGNYWETADGASGESGTSGSSGSSGGVSDLDVWGDAILQKMLLVGIDPTSSYASSLIHMGAAGTGGVVAYVFGELQAFDYRAVGKEGSIGVYSVETADGVIAALIGGDDAAAYAEGASGESGESGPHKKVGIHLVEADTLVVDKDAGDAAAFVSVQGDMEVVRGLSVRNIQCNAVWPQGVMVINNGTQAFDTTKVIRKDFASFKPMKLKGDDAWPTSGVSGPEVTYEAWEKSSASPLGEYGSTGTPGVANTKGAPELTTSAATKASLLDALVLASLGELQVTFVGRSTIPRMTFAGQFTEALPIISKYNFVSPFFGEQDWLASGSASFRNLVTARVDLSETPGSQGYADASHIYKSLQVYISPYSWNASSAGGVSGVPYYYQIMNSFGHRDAGPNTYLAQNMVNYAFFSRDCAIDSSGMPVSRDPVNSTPLPWLQGYEYQQVHKTETLSPPYTGFKTSDYILALYPRLVSATKVSIGLSGDFNWDCRYDVQLCVTSFRETVISRVLGHVIVADGIGAGVWSSTNMPWSFQDRLPWADPYAIQAAINTDKFVYVQATPSTVWTVVHDLDGYPTVEVLDTAGEVVLADVKYDSPTTLTITLIAPLAGRAVLN